MLQNILNFNGAQELSAKEQASINGGGGICYSRSCPSWCVCNQSTNYICDCTP